MAASSNEGSNCSPNEILEHQQEQKQEQEQEPHKDDEHELSVLKGYHPVVVEGMGYYDPRDPDTVASNLVASIRSHLEEESSSLRPIISKPLLVISQGDPRSERGISAITPRVAEALSEGMRGLVCLDPSIDPSHSRDADRTNVIAEIHYSQLVDILTRTNSIVSMKSLEAAIDSHIRAQNKGRALVGKPPVKEYFKTYALLQEVTKAGLRELCGGSLTVAHTSTDINPFSVTSFYEVGLQLGLYHPSEVVTYRPASTSSPSSLGEGEEEAPLDFDAIDPR
jgi:hypothetical protein